AIEAWLLHWLLTEPLRRADFVESSDGNCRISSRLCSKLSETALTWRKLVAPWAQYVAHSLYSGRPRVVQALRTPLTQTHRRDAKGAPAPVMKMPKTEHVCRGCGKPIRKGSECWNCAQSGARARMVNAATFGRVAARRPEARLKHSQSARRHALARSSWDAISLPAWLTSEFFAQEVQPLLANVDAPKIRSAIGVSHWYANKIRQGYRPHPRHWEVLAELVGISADV